MAYCLLGIKLGTEIYQLMGSSWPLPSKSLTLSRVQPDAGLQAIWTMGKLGSLPIVRGTSKTNYYVKLWKVYWRSLTVEECLHMAWLGYSHLFWKNRADNLFRSLKFLFICFICVLHKNLSWFSNIIMTSLANCLACFFPEVGIDCSILSTFSSLVSLTTDIIRHLIWNSREI